MADVFQEVDEMMKQERLQKIWKENGNLIITFVVLVIVMTGAISAYKSWNQSVQEKQTAALIAAIENPNFENSIMETAKNFRADLRGTAYMTAAAKYAFENKYAEALPLYNAVKADSGIDADMRDLAKLLAVRATLQTAESPDSKALKSDLESIWHKTGSPWKYHAHMETALILAEYENDLPMARSHLKEILTAENLPASLYEKASALDHVFELQDKKNKQKSGESNGEG